MITSHFERLVDRLVAWFSRTPWASVIPAVSAAFSVVYLLRCADYDLFARLAVGRLIVANGSVPRVDPFAYTPTKPIWYDHEWLSGLLFYGTSQFGGDVAIFLLGILFATATLFLLHRCQRETSRNPAFAAIVLFVAFFPCSFVWNNVIRSHVITYLFFSVLLLGFIRFRQRKDPRVLWCAPLAMVPWANAHGGFVVGLGMLGIFAAVLAVERNPFAPRMICIVLLSVLATLVNPYGIEYWPFIVESVTMHRSIIPEWAAINIFSPQQILLVIFIGVVICGLAGKWRSIPLEAKIFLALMLFFGVKHQRFIPFFYFVVVAYCSDFFLDLYLKFEKRFPKRAIAFRRAFATFIGIVVGTSAFLGLYFLGTAQNFALRYDLFPVAAVSWLLENRPGGKILNHFNEGSYLLWRMSPRFQIALDGRYEEVYPNETVFTVLRAISPGLSEQRKKLQQVWPDYIVICNTSLPQFSNSDFGADWYLLYRDLNCRVFGTEPNADGVIATSADK